MIKALVGNGADKKQVRDARSKEAIDRDNDIKGVREVLSSKSGRRFYWKMLAYCGVFTSSFTGDNQTFFLEGKRQVGLKMLADLNEADQEAYLKMMNEAKGES